MKKLLLLAVVTGAAVAGFAAYARQNGRDPLELAQEMAGRAGGQVKGLKDQARGGPELPQSLDAIDLRDFADEQAG